MSEEQKHEEQAPAKKGSHLKWILLAAAGIPIAWLGFCEARKTYWDMQVNQMCEKEGGVKSFEKVKISSKENSLQGRSEGKISVPAKGSSSDGLPYFSEGTTTHIKTLDPEVWRREELVKRKSDNQVVAKWVFYARMGGDFSSS